MRLCRKQSLESIFATKLFFQFDQLVENWITFVSNLFRGPQDLKTKGQGSLSFFRDSRCEKPSQPVKTIEILLELVCLRWSSKHFWRKNPCTKYADLRPRQGNLLQRNIFTELNKNLSLQHKIGWRPAEKNRPFYQHASSSSKISMVKTLSTGNAAYAKGASTVWVHLV
jgi:hypothetical protein